MRRVLAASALLQALLCFHAFADDFVELKVKLPDIAVSSKDIDFKEVEVGASISRDLVIKNEGKGDLKIGRIELVQNVFQFLAFDYDDEDCRDETLEDGESCKIVVIFAPRVTGDLSAALVIPSNDPDEMVVTVPLKGKGVAPAPEPAPKLSVSTSTLAFPETEIDHVSKKTLTIRNEGSAPLLNLSISTPPAPFSIFNKCTSVLNAGASCAVEVSFEPMRAASFVEQFVIRSNEPDITVTLQGTGTAPPPPLPPPATPVIQVTDSIDPRDDRRLPFREEVGRTASATVTIANTGEGTLLLRALGTKSLLGTPFSAPSDRCSNQSLEKGQSCEIKVVFTPESVRTYGVDLILPSNSQDIKLELSGEGIAPPPPPTPATPVVRVTDSIEPVNDLRLPFQTEVGRTATGIVTISNAGEGTLLLQALDSRALLGTPFSVTGDGCSNKGLEKGASCDIQVDFTPERPEIFSEGDYNLVLATSDQDVTILLSGQGTASPPPPPPVSGGNRSPSTPALIYPGPQQTDLKNEVTFRWETCRDPDGDAVSYKLYVSDGADFSGVEPHLARLEPAGESIASGSLLLLFGISLTPAVFRQRRLCLLALALVASGFLLSCGGGEVEDSQSKTVGDLRAGTTYYWKVVADDGRGGQSESEVRSFATRPL